MIALCTQDGRRQNLTSDPQLTLAQAIFLAGLWKGVPLCAGLGKCGLCRVRFLSAPPPPFPEETRRLGQTALAEGWRLSCLHPATACKIELPEPKRSGGPRQLKTSETAKTASGTPAGELTLAVDLGTTSVHWAAQAGGTTLYGGQELNPQMGLGSEVMSRLGFAARPGGAETLRQLAVERLRELLIDQHEAVFAILDEDPVRRGVDDRL